MQSSDIDRLINRGRITTLQISVIFLCFLINMLDGFDVLSIAYTAPKIADEWALSPERLGIVFSASLVGMTLGAMFIAPLADRFGRRKLILACMVAISGSMVLSGFVSSVNELMLVRAITGLGIGGMLASINTMVAEYTPDRSRNLMIGLLHVGYSFGAAMGGVIAAIIMETYGWRSVFLIGGVASVLMLFVIYLVLPESMHFLIDQKPDTSVNQVNSILSRLGHEPATSLEASPNQPESSGLKGILVGEYRSWSYSLWACFFMSMLTLYFLLSWTPKILTSAGLPLDQAIYAGVTLNVGGGIGMLFLGHISKWLGLRQMIRLFFVLGAACMALFAALGQQIALLLVITFFMGLFIMGGFIGLYSVAARLYPTKLRNTGLGWAIGIGRLGAIAGPYLAGIFMGFGWEQANYYLILSLPLVLTAILISGIKTSRIEVGKAQEASIA